VLCLGNDAVVVAENTLRRTNIVGQVQAYFVQNVQHAFLLNGNFVRERQVFTAFKHLFYIV
jgi:hypothetical protein